MRKILFLPVLMFAFIKAYSNNVNGYIVTLSNDTVSVQIKISGGSFIGIGHYNVYKKVQILDSTGGVKILTPNDIKAYGYVYKSKEYIYRKKPVKDGSAYFLEPIAVGTNTSLYQYEETVPQGQNMWTTRDFYTFEKPNGTYLFLNSFDDLEKLKEELKKFYSEYSDVQKLVDEKFNARRHIQKDIREIIETINKS